jgi:hypothetical protein
MKPMMMMMERKLASGNPHALKFLEISNWKFLEVPT